jgi:DNA-binding NarL/FixJ family response regulator
VRLYRESLIRRLLEEPSIRIVGDVDRCDHLLAAVQRAPPDVVVLDIGLPNSRQWLSEVRAAKPELKIIALGIPEHGQAVIAWAEAGADGYVAQEASVEDFVATVRAVAGGELRCSPRVAAALIRRVFALASRGTTTPAAVLTPRELEILELVERGFANKQIAQRLSIRVPTVKNHVHNILEKLHARGRGEAAALLRSHLHENRSRTAPGMSGSSSAA